MRAGRGRACMGKPLSTDLRTRLVTAVAVGLPRRAAAERFGASPANAMRGMQAVITTGLVEAKPQGGDTRSRRIEAFREVILGAIEAQKDISPVELAKMLQTDQGAPFAASTPMPLPRPPPHDLQKNRARSRAGAGRRRRAAQDLARRYTRTGHHLSNHQIFG